MSLAPPYRVPLSRFPLSRFPLHRFPLWERLHQESLRIVVSDVEGGHSGETLCHGANAVAIALGQSGIEPGDRVLFCVPPGSEYVAALLGIWRVGAVAVPLALSHPPAEWSYFAKDTKARFVLVGGQLVEQVTAWSQNEGILCIGLSELSAKTPPASALAAAKTCLSNQDAMILYTSGTTSRPKGVVISHGQLEFQISVLCDAWGWEQNDAILHVLPLHHVHGIVNILLCALWSGARCDFLPRFDANEVWRRFSTKKLTLFMAVPTIYRKLMDAFYTMGQEEQKEAREAASGFRLMVSGSAALPADLFEKWQETTGQTLLERYGMTEIGMALSNPYRGERLAGTVGRPLPGVLVRLVDEEGNVLHGDAASGEIQVSGPSVFKRYWNGEDATRDAFTEDGWFRTGDIAKRDGEIYKILGRSNIDIIKTGGYKVSALEIEALFLRHEEISACAVIGVPHEIWGEEVVLVLEESSKERPAFAELIAFARPHLAPYKLPKSCRIIGELPRNALGKLQKKKIAEILAQKT